MKILHIVPYFPPDRIGGVGEVAAHVHRGLLDLGYESWVVTSGASSSDDRVIRVARSPGSFVIRSSLAPITPSDFDIVHAHHGEAWALLARVRLRRLRPRILVTMHVSNRRLGQSYRPFHLAGHRYRAGWEGWSQCYVKSHVKHLTDQVAMRLADRVSFISKSSAADVLGPQAAAGASIVYNGLPVQTESYNGNDVQPVELLYVGTASQRKRTDLLPLILAAVRETHPAARLRIVGFDLQSQPRLCHLFGERGLLDSVVCEGGVLSDQIEPFYRAAQVLIVPSAYEGLPMVIIEGFRSGLPCVATDVGGNSEIIEDGVNGFLVEVDRPDSIAQRCSELLGNPNMARKMGDAGRALMIEEFTDERQVLGYLSLYREMLEGAGCD